MDEKKIDVFVGGLGEEEREFLRQDIDDPDTLMTSERIPLMEKIDQNLLVDTIPRRDPRFWAGEPPEKDLELGIGRRVAWQTPLHREAVRWALEES
ncbi:MAG: hypothetical protein QXE89_08855 [Pyrobaculum sp.]